MAEEKTGLIYSVYVIGKDTPNKLKLSQMLGGKETGDGNSEVRKAPFKFNIRNIPEEEVEKIEADPNAFANYFIYVYNVDDKETFKKYENIREKLKKKFENKEKYIFVLYGINCNIENKRSVSQEELMLTANKNMSFYFELQKFDVEMIQEQLRDYVYSYELIYLTGIEESMYFEFFKEDLKKTINKSLEKSFNEYKIRHELLLPMKIEEMRPLEEILEEAFEGVKRIGIRFIYSSSNRETFTAIKEYISKCSNLEKYYELPLCIQENDLIDNEEKEREVTTLEVKIFCHKKRIEFSEDHKFKVNYIPPKIEKSKDEIIVYFKDNEAPIEDYKIDELNNSGMYKIKEGIDGARIYIVDLSKNIRHFDVTVDDNDYIIAGEQSNIEGNQVREREDMFIEILKPQERQHYITFKKNKIENVFKQYQEYKEPAKETIHIFCNSKFQEKLLDNKIVEFVNEEEFKFVRFANHIFKYKVVFHDDNEYSFTEEMKHILCFIENDDESRLKNIQDSKSKIIAAELSFHVIVENTQKLKKDKEQELIEHFEKEYQTMSNDFVPIPIIESDKEVCEYHKLFTHLLKREESTDQIDENTCCRI